MAPLLIPAPVIDRIPLDSTAGKAELQLLQSLHKGNSRNGLLLPALPTPLTWVLVAETVSDKRKVVGWEFSAMFHGQKVVTVTIAIEEPDLVIRQL